MWRSVGAVAAGFGVATMVVIVGTLVAAKLFVSTDGLLTSSYLVANLASSAAGAILGGWTAGRVARHRAVAHGIALAAVLFLLSLPSVLAPQPGQPSWYPVTIMLLGSAGAVLGVLAARPGVTAHPG